MSNETVNFAESFPNVAACYEIIKKFERSTFYPNDKSHGGTSISSAEKHVLMFLWFAGNKCSLRQVGHRFNLSILTYKNVTKRMDFLNDISKEVIIFSYTSEKNVVAENFKKSYITRHTKSNKSLLVLLEL